MNYTYERHVYLNGKPLPVETKTMDSHNLASHTNGKVGREAFLELVNKWNRAGLLNRLGMIYVYIAK